MTPDPRAAFDRAVLDRAALRVTADDPGTVGYWLARHRVAEGLTADALAAELGTDAPGLARLALCLAPTADAFAADVRAVADRSGADPAALAGLLRKEQGVAAWAAGGPPAAAAGWLIAAHDADRPPGDPDDPGGG